MTEIYIYVCMSISVCRLFILGVSVELREAFVHVGNVDYMTHVLGLKNVSKIFGVGTDARNHRTRLEEAGKTVVYIGLCDAIIALIGISDMPRPEAKQTVAELHAQGMDVYMVSGDNHRTALWVATEVGIPSHHVMSEILPSMKAAKVCPH
jgi:P-type E1-E2 ATPase